MNANDDLIKLSLTVLLGSVGLIVGSQMLSKIDCETYSEMTGMKTEYKALSGCFVQTKKGWFLKEQLRDIQVEKGDE